MKRTTASFVLVAAIIQIACQSSIPIREIFRDAHSRIDLHPDSALLVLKTLDPKKLRRRALRARYALLYSQALDNSRIDLRSDSVIAPAVAYYSRHGRAEDRAYTNYYLGCIRYNAGNIDGAVQAMLAAETHAAGTKDTCLLARICNCLGNMYCDQHRFEDAGIMFGNVETYYQALCDTPNMAYAAMNRAEVHSLTARSAEAVGGYLRARNLFERMGDSMRVSEMTRDIVREMLDRNDVAPDSLRRLLCRAYSVSGFDRIPCADYPMWAAICLREKKLDSARHYGMSALADSSVSGNKRCGMILQMCRIEESSGNYRTATEYWHAYYDLFDSVVSCEREQLVQEAEQRYRNREFAGADKLLRRRTRSASIIWGAILVLCLAVFVAIHVRRGRRYRQFVETLNEDYDAFRNRCLQLAGELDRTSAEEANLLGVLGRLLTQFLHLLDKGYGTSSSRNLINEFKKYAKSIGNDKSLFADWQFIVNKQYYGLIDHLRKTYPELTGYELDLLCLLQLKFPFNCIRLLYQHENVYSLYSRRTKLHKKLGLSSGCRLEDFLSEQVERLKEDRRYSGGRPD